MEAPAILTDLPSLETPRLLLRKMRLDDAAEMFEYASDPQVSQYTTWTTHQTLEDSKKFLHSVVARYETEDALDWGIVCKVNQKFIGSCGIIIQSEVDRRAEIGYALSRAYWGQGYITEAAQALLKFGFISLNLNRIEALCKVENLASARVMEKIGMTFEGVLRQQMWIKGEFWDFKIYSILRKEYEENYSNLVQ